MSFYKEDSLMRSDQIKKGVERAPNRSLLYALGYTEKELNRPLVGGELLEMDHARSHGPG